MQKVLFKSEEKKDVSEVASILRTIADKVESGQLVLSQGEEQLHLDIPKNVTFELKVDEKKKPGNPNLKKSLEIELEWLEGEDGKPSYSGDLSIG